MALAERLRQERRLRHWTLNDLAHSAGISKSLLSKIERNQVSPSLRTLKALAAGLDLPLARLLQEEHLEQYIVRKDQRQQFSVPGSPIRREVIAPDVMRQLTLLIAYFEPGQTSHDDPDSHLGEECVHVIRGQIEVMIGGQTTRLNEGDTLYFDASLPHLFDNSGSEAAEVLVALLYPPGPPQYLDSLRPAERQRSVKVLTSGSSQPASNGQSSRGSEMISGNSDRR